MGWTIQEKSEQDEIDGMKKEGHHSTDRVMHNRKEQLVICNEEDAWSSKAITIDEERVLHVDKTEIRLCRYSLVGCENLAAWRARVLNLLEAIYFNWLRKIVAQRVQWLQFGLRVQTAERSDDTGCTSS